MEKGSRRVSSSGDGPLWTFEECLRHGGHCYIEQAPTVEPGPSIWHRHCKHCGWVQESRRPEPLRWYDDEHQPFVEGTTQAEREWAGGRIPSVGTLHQDLTEENIAVQGGGGGGAEKR